MHPRVSFATLALSLCCLGGGDALAAPRGASTKDPGSRAKRSRTRKKRGAKRKKRETRGGLPVLRSRKTPGRSQTRQAEPEPEVTPPPPAAVVAGAFEFHAPTAKTLLEIIPPKSVWLGGNQTFKVNAWLNFTGAFYGKEGVIQTKQLRIHYPLPGALGKGVQMRCWNLGTTQSQTVEVVGRRKNGTEMVFDAFTITPGNETKADGSVGPKTLEEFGVIIDSDVEPEGFVSYRIDISAANDVMHRGCLLEVLDD